MWAVINSVQNNSELRVWECWNQLRCGCRANVDGRLSEVVETQGSPEVSIRSMYLFVLGSTSTWSADKLCLESLGNLCWLDEGGVFFCGSGEVFGWFYCFLTFLFCLLGSWVALEQFQGPFLNSFEIFEIWILALVQSGFCASWSS